MNWKSKKKQQNYGLTSDNLLSWWFCFCNWSIITSKGPFILFELSPCKWEKECEELPCIYKCAYCKGLVLLMKRKAYCKGLLVLLINKTLIVSDVLALVKNPKKWILWGAHDFEKQNFHCINFLLHLVLFSTILYYCYSDKRWLKSFFPLLVNF